MSKAVKKKVLFTSHVANFQKFNRPFMRMLAEQGWEVHYASDGEEKILDTDKEFTIPFERSPFKLGNIKAYFKLKKIIDHEKYDMIHTHTPMGSVVTRLAARAARKKGTRVIYTAHGFHFFKGAPIANWLIYYPIEKYMARHTDTLITINNEDFERAKAKFRTDVQYVPGVGIDPKKFDVKMSKAEKSALRKSLGLKDSDFVMIYVAELSKRKNQLWLINALSEFMYEHDDVHLVLPGKDSLNGVAHVLVAKLKLEKQIHFLGYRDDIPRLMKVSNMAVSASRQEGLPVNVMEAMYLGLPVVATDCRGNRDLASGGNGFIVPLNGIRDFCEIVSSLYSNPDSKVEYVKRSKKFIEKYLLSAVISDMSLIYATHDNEPLRVLHVVTIMNRAGLETMLMNYYRNIDRSKIQFDFIVHRDEKGVYDDEILSLGGNIYKFKPIGISNLLTYPWTMLRFLRRHPEYRTVHSHIDALSALPLMGAKMAGIKMRIAHSHNNNFSVDGKYILRKIIKKPIPYFATRLLACSRSAGDFMFGEDSEYGVFKNAIDLSSFVPNSVSRKLIRASMGIDDELVVGHVGRFSHQKNHTLLINIFKALLVVNPRAKLILVGDGIEKVAIENLVSKLGISSSVFFLGERGDIPDVMQAIDVFVMPSLYEGLPVVSIEAQASGLPCVFSGVVTDELDVTGRCSFVSLESDLEVWVSEIMHFASLPRDDTHDAIKACGYDISTAVLEAENMYLEGSQ